MLLALFVLNKRSYGLLKMYKSLDVIHCLTLNTFVLATQCHTLNIFAIAAYTLSHTQPQSPFEGRGHALIGKQCENSQ